MVSAGHVKTAGKLTCTLIRCYAPNHLATLLMVLDSRFRVELIAATPNPQQCTYAAMHQDYSEGFVADDRADWPDETRAGEIIVKRLLAGERGHYGPLEHAQIVLNVGWFPHSVMQQARTHRVGCCLGGDTLVSFGHPSLSKGEVYYQKTIKELAELWLRGRSHHKTQADADYMKSQISSRALLHVDEETGLVEHTKIVDIYENGVRDVWLIRLTNGVSIEATLDHKVLTPSGWVTFGDLEAGSQVLFADSVPLSPPSTPEEPKNEEIWRQIPGFQYYEVSSHGNVRSWAPKKHRGALRHPESPRYKKPSKGASGRYLYVSMVDTSGGVAKRKNIHELVLSTFIGPKPEGYVGRHINGCATDNRIENLEWSTPFINAADRVRDNLTNRKKAITVAVESMLYIGKQPTYDIEVEGPFHNFLANGIVVHNSFDVQSMRYTGERICRAANGELELEEVFYLRPQGQYKDRQGKRYAYTAEQRQLDLGLCQQAAERYRDLLAAGFAEEHARGILPFDYRQHFVVSFSLRAFLHFMDLRAKLDAQEEIRALCELMWPHMQAWAPEIAAWYEKHRLHRARLAP